MSKTGAIKGFILLFIIIFLMIIPSCSSPDSSGSGSTGVDVINPDPNPVNHSFSPAIAWNGSGYGIVWEYNMDGNNEIYYSQEDADGKKNVNDVKITNMQDNIYDLGEPSLVWNGNGYGIAWQDFVDGNYEIYFTIINTNGDRICNDVRITNSPDYSIFPTLIWNGREYGLAWSDGKTGITLDIYFIRINANGEKNGDILRITDTNGEKNSLNQSLVWNTNRNEYGIVWVRARKNDSEIYFTRIKDGIKTGGDVKISNDLDDGTPSLAWNKNKKQYGIAWIKVIENFHLEIYFAQLDEDGIKIGGMENDIQITDELTSVCAPSLVWNERDDQYGVAWTDGRDGNVRLYLARINSENGNKIEDEVKILDNTPFCTPSIVWNGNEYGVACVDNRKGYNEIYFTRINADGTKNNNTDVKISQ